MVEIGYAGAFLGGVLTLFSPCAVMLLPSFFAYSFAGRGALIGRTGVFLLGLLTTLVPLGMGAGLLGGLLVAHRQALLIGGSLLVIVLGLLLALGLPLPGLARGGHGGTGPVAVYLLGMTYGLAGTCTGPILGSLLTYAALSTSSLYGGLLFACYAVGMVVPLFVLALLWERFDLGRSRWLRPRPVRLGRIETTVTNLVSGGLLVGLGVLMLLTEGTAGLAGPLTRDSAGGPRGRRAGLGCRRSRPGHPRSAGCGRRARRVGVGGSQPRSGIMNGMTASLPDFGTWQVLVSLPAADPDDLVAACEVLLQEGFRTWSLPFGRLAALPRLRGLFGRRATIGVHAVTGADQVTEAVTAGASLWPRRCSSRRSWRPRAPSR